MHCRPTHAKVYSITADVHTRTQQTILCLGPIPGIPDFQKGSQGQGAGQTDRRREGRAYGLTGGRADGRTGGQMGGRADSGEADGRAGGRADGQIEPKTVALHASMLQPFCC